MSLGLEDTSPAPASRSGLASLQSGDRVGRYLVLDRLGAGGMGVVYSAYDPELDRKVAIKLLLPRPFARARPMERAYGEAMHRLFGDPQPTPDSAPDPEQQRLLREAQATAQLSDPNVVTVHDVGEHEGHVFVAMEFVQGTTLREWLARERRSWREVLAVMAKAGAGLAAAHAKGLVHRDFKPDNVMIGDDGRVVVMDFGLVRPTGELDRTTSREHQPTTDALGLEITRAGAVIGTPAYMSPEQFLGHAVDHLSDQFSFCVATWEALYGQRPFRGESLVSLATAVTEGERVPAPRDAAVPRAIERVLDIGLATDPAERHASMRALLAELARDPSRTRKRILGAATLVGAIGIAAAAWGIERARARASCANEGAHIHDIWSADARARVEMALRDSKAVYAETTFAKLTPWLDRYAEGWETMRVEACNKIAFRQDGRELAAKTVACLDRKASRFSSLIDELAGADESTVRGAVQRAASVAPLSECTNEAALVRTPGYDQHDPELNALEDRLDRAQVLERAGQLEEALAIVDAVIADARDVPHALVMAKLQRGSLLILRGDYEAAEHELTETLFTAAELDDDANMARAAVLLANVIAYYQRRPEDAEIWIRWGRALVRRLDTDEDMLTASLNEKLSLVEYARGHHEEALAIGRDALASKEALYGLDHPEVAVTLNNIAVVQIAGGALPDALVTLERALAITEEALGPDHPDYAASLTNLAQIRFLSGDHEGSREAMERVVSILGSTLRPDHPDLAKALGNLATVLQALGKNDEALAVAQRSLRGLQAGFGSEHPSVAKGLLTVGQIEQKLGRIDEAIAHHEQALAIQKKVLDPGHADIAGSLDALGEDYAARGDHETALRHYREALKLLQAGEKSHQEPQALFHVGRSEIECGRPQAAIEPLRRAAALYEEYGMDPSERALVLETLARAEALSRGTSPPTHP
jgi:tetratricopeptide (TPR) repeat protein